MVLWSQYYLLTFILLELLQVKQNKIINNLSYRRVIVLNIENNQKYIQDNIV